MTDKSIARHTPGPWHRDQYGSLLDANGRNVMFRGVAIAAAGSMVAEAEKNTDLIAAAPDLLVALDHPLLRHLFGEIEDSSTPEAQKLWAYAMAWFDVKDAAITKANEARP